jgi:hypothetical protein
MSNEVAVFIANFEIENGLWAGSRELLNCDNSFGVAVLCLQAFADPHDLACTYSPRSTDQNGWLAVVPRSRLRRGFSVFGFQYSVNRRAEI